MKRKRQVEDGLHARLRIQRDEAREAVKALMAAFEMANALLDAWEEEDGDDINWFPPERSKP